jgi:NAD(P)-dependent dehydrogenase (short-subunit alcohol dehydrogenase family)
MEHVALVTGASRGIGAAAARAFARSGYSVVLAARSEDSLRSVAAEIESRGGRALPIATDVTEASSVDRLLRRTLEEFGGLDAAFNNAGGGAPPTPLAEMDPHMFESAVKTNLFGTFLCMRAEIPAMRLHKSGTIVNMSSTAGLQGVAGLGAYCASKHAIVGLSKVAALDYAADGIRVNVVAPGPIGTERIPEQEQARIGRFVPVKRVGLLEEVAELVVWLCSPESAFITGTVVPIDGGRLAGTPSFAISP